MVARVADASTELYVSTCVLRRLDELLRHESKAAATTKLALAAGRYYLITASRRIRQSLAALWDNDDDITAELAKQVYGQRK